MKILMLLENEYLRDTRVEKEVQTLFKAGHEVIVAAITFSGLSNHENLGNCIVLRKSISKFIQRSSVGALKIPVYFNFWRRFVREILKKHEIEAIHIHDLPLCRIGIELKRQKKVKLILDLHENWPALLGISIHANTFLGKILSSEKQWRSYEKNCSLEADAVITVANEMKERISNLGISSKKIFVLENTPDNDSVSELKFETDNKFFTLIYIGGISYHRGLQYAIDGLRLLVPELPVRLWIAGDGKFSDNLKAQVKSLDLQDFVVFFGLLPKTKTVDLMKKADLGLIPHIRSEQSDNSSPNKLFEYMAAGLPVLASNCISIKRVLDETEAGITYIFDSPSDFANVVKIIYNNRGKSGLFVSNGIKAIREKYNWQQGSASLVKLYAGFK